MPQMNIRLATQEDLIAIEACARAAYEPYVQHIGKEPAPMVADFENLIDQNAVYVLEDSTVAGFAVFYPEGDHIHLENVAVHPSHQGQGYGGALMAFVESRTREAGINAIELYTHEKMTQNQNIYRHLGYLEIERRREAGFDRIYYRKVLP